MRAFWVDRETNTSKIVNTDGGLTELYRMCHCDCIDIAVVSIGGIPLNVVVDDIGLLRDKPMGTVFDTSGTPVLFGSVVFFGFDDETDDLAGLSNDAMDALLNNTMMVLMSDLSSRCVTIVDRR